MVKKKKRTIKTTVYVSLEGEREEVFFNFLKGIFKPKENNINITVFPNRGGSSNSILSNALKNSNCYKKCFAWFDEDDSLSRENRESLESKWGCCECKFNNDIKDKDLQKNYNIQNKNPIIIVSNPTSVDGLLIRILCKKLPEISSYTPKQKKKRMKSAFSGIINNNKGSFNKEEEMEYYKKHLTKEILEKKRKEIFELDLLISIFENKS